jgi:hypothetical protein
MKLFSKILFVCCLLAALSLDVSAQVGEVGGPIIQIDYEAVCDDGTTVFAVMQKVVGVSGTSLLGYVDATGSAHTLSGGTLTAGFCGGGTGVAAIDYTTTVQLLCDDGTPFYRVSVFTKDTLEATSTGDFELDLSTPYGVSGTVFSGPCNITQVAAITRIISTTTGTISAGALSFEICNEGATNGTVTFGGGAAATLIPGSCTSFKASLNPVTRRYSVSPAISYDATGTQFAVLAQN